MSSNYYFYIIIGITIVFFIIDKFIDYLNTLNWSKKIPLEFKGIYDEEKYKKSILYEKAKYKFSFLSSLFSFILILLVLSFGLFGYLDTFLREYFINPIVLSLVFFGVIFLLHTIINLPLSYYFNFTIEEKFGFNKMTKKLFFIDNIKSIIISLIVGGILLFLIIYVYNKIPNNFWWITWIILTAFSIFFIMFYSSLIVPIFNKQTPLEEGELRTNINNFAKKVGFTLDNIYVIDGGKRSSKANAYFSGFGPKKRIVLYDTLIKDLTTNELVAVLAHEIGHYKKKHTIQNLIFSFLQTGFILFLFSLIINNQEIAHSLGAIYPSFHIGLLAFLILFTPISFLLGILGNIISRKNEYEADEYSKTYYSSSELIGGLKKLSVNNLSNLNPHYVYEFVHYTHPSVIKRIEKLKL